MKKRIYLLIVAVMLTILAACGADKNHGESGNESSKSETGAGHEMSGAETGIEGTVSGTKEGGENTESADYEYEKITLSYSESVNGFSFRKDLKKTQTDFAVYYFEPSISNQERNACIGATDKMLSCIDAALPDLEVVVLKQESYDGVSVSGNRLYITLQPWDSVDYLAKVLLAGYGEWGNYGLAYGYADYLCKKAGSGSGEANTGGREADSFLPMSAPEAYDLNLLCFDERFVSSKDVEAAKNNACLFVEDYLSSHSEEEFLELLSASGTMEGAVRAKEALEAFYAKNGVECSLTEIRYQYGGVAFDYGAACEYARFYIDRDWQDLSWEMNPILSEIFLHEDYGEVRKFFECNEYQMWQYQELFGFDSYNNDLCVFMKNQRVTSPPSFYHELNHTINLESVVSLMHEYIHSLMFGHSDFGILWKREGSARYFSSKYNLYSYDVYNDDWNSQSWLQEYIHTLGRPIDVRKDICEVENITAHVYGRTDPNSAYIPASSFVGYLVGQYGEQAVIAYICSDEEYNEEWGKSYDELVQEWNQYIEDNYSQYSMNAMQ